MELNPLSIFVRRKVDEIFDDDAGWAEPQAWPVPRPGRKPLIFRSRMPAAFELIEVTSLSADELGIAASVGRAAITLDRASQTDGVFLVGAIAMPLPDARRVIATMTVALMRTPLPFTDATGAGWYGERERVKQIYPKVTVIEREDMETFERNADPIPVLTIQYTKKAPYGTLTTTFLCPDSRFSSQSARMIFLQIVKAGYLD